MNIRILTAAASLALIAAALPTAALAKGAIAGTETPHNPSVVVVAHDKPQVTGFSTDPSEFSDEDCQGFANQIEDDLGAAIDALDSNDMDTILANLDDADATESLAGEMGCVITIAKTAGGKTHGTFTVGVSAQDSGQDKPKAEGWQTGEGTASDEECQAHANDIHNFWDLAGDSFESGDYDSGFHYVEVAELSEDSALDKGCAVTLPQ